jgi:hypothetical protein
MKKTNSDIQNTTMWKLHNRPLLQENEPETFDEKSTDLQD